MTGTSPIPGGPEDGSVQPSLGFFFRYYEEGDFIPKRRYGARETYAVPYKGEEVFFHWANRDQHYVKTTETLRDYAFAVDMLGKPCRVRWPMPNAIDWKRTANPALPVIA